MSDTIFTFLHALYLFYVPSNTDSTKIVIHSQLVDVTNILNLHLDIM